MIRNKLLEKLINIKGNYSLDKKYLIYKSARKIYFFLKNHKKIKNTQF